MKKLFLTLTISALMLSACSASAAPEKERFINATVEVTCMIFESGDLLDPALEEDTKAVFEEYGFDVEDEEAMLEIAAKYENDPEVQAAVEEALMECAGDLFGGAMMEEEAAPEAMEAEESTVKEDDAEVEARAVITPAVEEEEASE